MRCCTHTKPLFSLWSVLLVVGCLWPSWLAGIGTFKQQLQGAVGYFQAGDYANAYTAFESLESVFHLEPEFKEMQKTILPLHGYACLSAGDHAKAVTLLAAFLRDYPDAQQQRTFIVFSLAQAYQGNGQHQLAIDTYQTYIDAAPNTPEAAMSAMRQAELYFKLGQHAVGIDRLLTLATSETVAPSLQKQARLRALQQAQSAQLFERSLQIMLGEPWSITAMPELAILTFAALRAGENAMENQRYADAIRAYRLVPPLQVLIQAQTAKLNQLTTTFEERKAQARRGHLKRNAWDEHYQVIIKRVAQQLEALKNSEDYTPGFQLRLGQACLLNDRPREAYLLFKRLSSDADLPDAIVVQAHFHWVLAANALEKWNTATDIAQDLVQTFPEHELSQQALFLIASAHQQRKQYGEAVKLLSDLLVTYPNNQYASRWLFARGLNRAFQQDYALSRTDFKQYIETYPEGVLHGHAQLWIGLTFFFQKNYAKAIALFKQQKKQLPENHVLYPELEYRIAHTYYAQKQHTQALRTTNAFLKKYRHHARGPAATALRGDILMAQGKLEAAVKAFAHIPTSSAPLFTYGVFQTGKVYRALEDYEALIDHFKQYVSAEDIQPKTRIAEALYWTGWAYTQQQDLAQAFPLFLNALERYGNDLEAVDISSILTALKKLHKRYHQHAPPLPTELANSVLVQETDFFTWLDSEKRSALENQAYTYYARINVYLAEVHQQQQLPALRDAQLFEILEHVPDEALDAEGLAQLGRLLYANESSLAETYFQMLVEKFPQAPQRAVAFYHLAQMRWQEHKVEATEKWLNRFMLETPFHPCSVDATLLMGEVLTAVKKYERATQYMEDLLRLKSARGRPHARALLQLATIQHALQQPKKAIAYYQRIYTLYPAYTDLVATAYYQSALLFAALEDSAAAYKTIREMLQTPGIAETAEYAQAVAFQAELAPHAPNATMSQQATTANTPRKDGEVPL